MDLIQFALTNFEANRKAAESYVQLEQQILETHRHNWLCFRWAWCRRLEHKIKESEERIGWYRAAEEGLRRKDCKPAIQVLDRLIEIRRESALDIAHRWSHSPEPTPMSIKTDPIGVWKSIVSLRKGLQILQHSYHST
jgi:hypothetical protein